MNFNSCSNKPKYLFYGMCLLIIFHQILGIYNVVLKMF